MRIGMHMSVSRGFEKNLRRLTDFGCQAVQIFAGNPTGWRMGKTDRAAIARRVKLLQELSVFPLVIHSAYLINLASSSPETYQRSVELLALTMERAALYRSPYVVLHTGNHGGQGVERGLQKVTDTISRELERWPAGVELLLENTAGSGTALGSRLEELAAVVNNFPRNRVGVCLDTAHAWAAGYALDSPHGLEETLGQFDRLIGLDRLRALHVNDSKVACGSKVDRHQHLGKGSIGLRSFEALLAYSWPEEMPVILETPEMGSEWDHHNLTTLLSLVDKDSSL